MPLMVKSRSEYSLNHVHKHQESEIQHRSLVSYWCYTIVYKPNKKLIEFFPRWSQYKGYPHKD